MNPICKQCNRISFVNFLRNTSTLSIKNFAVSQNESKSIKKFSDIPHIKRSELILRFLPKGKYYGLGLNELHRAINEEFGNIVRMPSLFGKPEMIFSYNDTDNETLLRNESSKPYRYSFEPLKYFREKIRPDVYGGEYGSMASEHGDRWYKIRTLVNPIMLQPKMVQRYTESINHITSDFIDYILKRDLNKQISNRDLNLWSLESIANITLDRRLGLFNDTNSEAAVKMIDLIRRFFIMCADFEVSPSIWKYYHTKAFKEYMKVNNDLLNIVMNYIEETIEQTRDNQGDNANGILQQLLKIDKNVAIIMAVDSMTAGVDTTASAITGILYCLAKNPEKQEKLREEILREFTTPELNVKSFANLPYLRACIKEGMRFYPPVSGTSRKTDFDLVFSNYFIPKGTYVITWPQLFYRRENIFPQSSEYLPERWTREQKCTHLNQSTKFHFLPFGHGVRSCVGRRFANLEMEVFLINFLRRFKIEWNEDDLQIQSTFVNIPTGNVKFTLKKL
ncbi:cytochrome P450 CYP12A2-like [Chironomus tepperi]|uniref:cytochrome P450 CYP12A2-like n=1 Tax=Chironomus tepperi TaxID=113505 RepID=UPI00391F5CFD